jgi:hypothetical protein
LIAQLNNILFDLDCAALEDGKSFVTNELIPKSVNAENLSQMDPLWYPWL